MERVPIFYPKETATQHDVLVQFQRTNNSSFLSLANKQ